jgi:hypothetical protein
MDLDTPTPSPSNPSPPSDIAGLQADYQEILSITDAHRPPVNAPTNEDANRLHVVADNFLSCANLARALGMLIEVRNSEGSTVVFRSLYETSINLMYLYDVGDRTHNAHLARAYALLEIAENYRAAGAPGREVAHEHQRLYETVTKEIRRELAANRKKVKNHWSGVGLPTRAQAVGFIGHEIMYRSLSWDAHALALGRISFESKGDSKVLNIHRSLADKEAETIARMARACLRHAWARFSNEFFGSPIPLSAPAPDPRPGI